MTKLYAPSGAGEWIHLVQRFFSVVTTRRLSPAEQDEVAALLRNESEAQLYWDQPAADQRHGLVAARYARQVAPDRDDVVRAALLHDIGKRHSQLGVIGRSIAGAIRALQLPARGRVRRYLDHGEVGAAELEALGAEPLVVNYTRHHHDRHVPEGVAPGDWEILVAADHARG